MTSAPPPPRARLSARPRPSPRLRPRRRSRPPRVPRPPRRRRVPHLPPRRTPRRTPRRSFATISPRPESPPTASPRSRPWSRRTRVRASAFAAKTSRGIRARACSIPRTSWRTSWRGARWTNADDSSRAPTRATGVRSRRSRTPSRVETARTRRRPRGRTQSDAPRRASTPPRRRRRRRSRSRRRPVLGVGRGRGRTSGGRRTDEAAADEDDPFSASTFPPEALRAAAERLAARVSGAPCLKSTDIAPGRYLRPGVEDSAEWMPLDAAREDDPGEIRRAYCRAARVPVWVAEEMRGSSRVDALVKSMAYHGGVATGGSATRVIRTRGDGYDARRTRPRATEGGAGRER